MTILTHQTSWKRQPTTRRVNRTDLTPEERANARRALVVLKIRLGTWRAVGDALRISSQRDWERKRKTPSLSVAFRVARLVGVPLEEVLVGRWPTAGECPLCGHVRRALPASSEIT
jgi:hypothetical protein